MERAFFWNVKPPLATLSRSNNAVLTEFGIAGLLLLLTLAITPLRQVLPIGRILLIDIDPCVSHCSSAA